MMVLVLAVRQCAYIDPDLWWHLQTGQDIVLTRTIPHVDIYSFTKAGSEWVTHEWLSEVLMYVIYRLAGWAGLLLIFSSFILIALVITYRRCAGRPYIAGFAILLAAASSAPLFGIRPQMITFLLASIYIAILSEFSRNRTSRTLWWLVPLMLLWVNFHAGFALGLGLIGLFLVGLALDRKWGLIRPLVITLVACAAVVPLNPNGLRMFTYPLETLASPAMAGLIQEWASPDFHRLMYLPFAILIFTLLAVLAASPKRPQPSEIFLLVVTGLGGLRSVRHIPIFALIAAPVLAAHLWQLLASRGWDRRLSAPETVGSLISVVISLSILLAPATLAASRVWHFVAYQPAYEATNYPAAAVNFLVAERLPGPIYNRYGWGGYLIRRLYPDYRVFIDGRADVYGDAFMTETFNTYDGRVGWREQLERLAVQTVLIDPNAPLASLLRSEPGWQKIYEDKQAVIFTRP